MIVPLILIRRPQVPVDVDSATKHRCRIISTNLQFNTLSIKESADEDEQFAPVFLIPVLHQLIMAGKSMHLLFKLGKVKHVYPGKIIKVMHTKLFLFIAFSGFFYPMIDIDLSGIWEKIRT